MKRASRKSALIVLLLVSVAAVVYFSSRSAGREPTAPLSIAVLDEHVVVAMPVQIDTPPQLQAASGWPFAQLPHVAKFEVPVPRMSVTLVPETPYAPPVPVRSWPPPPVPSNGVSPLWLASPLAAGAYLVSADVSGPGSVVPEPATLLLLGS